MQTFRDFMEQALYHPERGFYSRRIPTQDFYTAPELHPAFAGVLARDVSARLRRLRAERPEVPLAVVEMGAGRGLLAEQLLQSLPADVRYVVVERSRGPREEALRRLSARFPLVSACASVDELAPCSGVFLSNELVDAFPVHLLEKRSGRVLEVFVGEQGKTELRELSRPELVAAAVAVDGLLQEGERHAVNLEAPLWLANVASKLERGWLLTVDYGKRFGASPNPPRSFFRHGVDDAVTESAGLKDITACVDFDALIAEGERRGLALERYETLARFLLDGGIADWIEGAPFASRAKVKTLLHPEGMGEIFKVLIQRKSELPS